jgi:signal transduction histidine kinase
LIFFCNAYLMNVSLAQDLSIYHQALDVQAPPSPLLLSPATVLSLVRSHIDLLIEHQIAATIWVKLPPGNIWHSEIQRYRQHFCASGVIYTCDVEVSTTVRITTSSTSLPNSYHQQAQLKKSNSLQREYFLIVLSPQFCSLIVAYRPLKRNNTHSLTKVNTNTIPSLWAISSFEQKVIQPVLDAIEQSIAAETSQFIPANFTCPFVDTAHATSLQTQLFAKQLQRQDEINRLLAKKRLAKVQQQNEKLRKTLIHRDDFLSNACQELRTPLTHMKTALSLLGSPNLKIPQRQRYLQLLCTQCDRQNALISGVVELAQLESSLEQLALESVRLVDIVPGVVSTYQPLAKEKGIMLAYTVPLELPAVWFVSGGLRQVVIHLLSNSIKFTSHGGQVWVRGRVQGDYVHLEFRDTGIGIAESDIPKIFERFYRLRPVASKDIEGAGLGLTIVELLLRRCGGSIFVKSKLSEGSSFTVQLAIAKEAQLRTDNS